MTIRTNRRRFIGGASALAAALYTGSKLHGHDGRVVAAQDGGTEFHGAAPYQDVGSGGHFNQFVVGGILNPPNLYGDLIFAPMGMLYWGSDEWLPLLASNWTFMQSGDESQATPEAAADNGRIPAITSRDDVPVEADIFQVQLREGVQWSDGSDVSSQDVVDTFDILRLQGNTVWNYLDSIEAVDPLTVNFHMSRPASVIERYVIRRSVLPSSVYGEWAQQARDLFETGATNEDGEWRQLLDQFNQYKPEEVVANGPYTIDQASITNAQMALVKNESSYWADTANFDRIINYNGETDTISAVVLSGDIDYARHGFAPATEQAMIEEGLRILRPPTFGGGSLIMNFGNLPQLRDKRVRQAMAHAIDREQAGIVSLADSGVPVEYMTGMSDNHVAQWVDDEAAASFNPYEYDLEKAAALLEEAGWTRDGDMWKDPDGQNAEFDIIFGAEQADYSATGLNVAEQLTAFGFNVTPRAITHTQVGPDILAGRFDMAIQTWGSTTDAHPHYSFVTAFITRNATSEGDVERGIDFPLVQETDVAGEIDIQELVIASAEGLDTDQQREQVTRISQVFNELLPIIPLYERYGNNPVLEGVRVKPWPEDDALIYQNALYADPFPTMMMFEGILEPV